MNSHFKKTTLRAAVLGLASVTLAPVAQAALLTGLPGVTTSAGSCYLGCGHPQYDHSNIIDGDYGASDNTGLDAWNSGFLGGAMQVNFGATYQLDRIELYGAYSYVDPYTLAVSLDGITWSNIASGAYHLEPGLSQPAALSYGGINFGAVHDVLNGTLASNVMGQYLRYTVNPGSPEWGYLFELRVDGHTPVVTPPGSVPEPGSLLLLGLGLAGMLGVRRRHH